LGKEETMKRKIIDAHAHAFIGKASAGVLGVPYEQIELIDRSEILLREMDKYGAGLTVLQVSHNRRESELHQSVVRKYPTRFVGFCRWGSEVTGSEAAEFIQKWLNEPEFKGVGEALIRNFYIPGKVETIPEALRGLRVAMDVVRGKKVPILFHTGYSGAHIGKFSGGIAWKDPLLLDEIAGEYSDVPIIIGHIGGHYPPYDINALMMAYQHDNVYLETSKSRPDVIEKAVAEIGSSRILFGTDWVREEPHTIGAIGERPAHLYDWNIKVVEEARISDEDKERIFYKNIKSLLDLP
jgi:predicted TIM-barrel fold metal-dependent hydrolase